MKKVLLHICCGICSSFSIEKLKNEGFHVLGLFYNPNIFPEEEYLRRLEAAKSVADLMGIKLLPGEYEPRDWLAQIKGLESEPEGGRRCAACFKMRLSYTAKAASDQGIDHFTTTLTISPHKNAGLINEIGRSVGRDNFLQYDFKKGDGFRKANAFAKNQSLYRQNYCGCSFSKREK